MSILNLQASYFAIENPLRRLDRWFNRYRFRARVRLNHREVEVRWTRRAQRALDQQAETLIVEMQLRARGGISSKLKIDSAWRAGNGKPHVAVAVPVGAVTPSGV